MEIKGTIIEVGEITQVTDTMQKREFIVEYIENPQYPEYLKFECIGDRTKLLDDVIPGDEVDVYFNLRGRPWTSKEGKKSYFNSLQMWKISVTQKVNQEQGEESGKTTEEVTEDDLPF